MTEIRVNHLRYAPWTLYVVVENGREILRQLSMPDELDIKYARQRERQAAAAEAARPTKKACIACGQVKPLLDFRPQIKGKFDRRARCRACEAHDFQLRQQRGRFQRAPAPIKPAYVDDSML